MLDDRSYMRQTPYHSPSPAQWPAAIWLIIANVVVFAAQLIVPRASGNGVELETYLALTPSSLAHGQVWQLITFQFLHGGLWHLLINCAMLYMFGRPVEQALGRKAFVGMYLASGAVGGLMQAACSWSFPRYFGDASVLGASAGVFALIAAFAALNWEAPLTMLLFFIIPVTIRAKYLILVEAIIGVLGLLAGERGIAHAAHLGGLLAGLGYIHFVFKSNRNLFDWSRFSPPLRRRELVGASAPKRTGWQRKTNTIPDDLPPAEFISREVDPILDKISAHGIQSLTERERRILEAARAKMSKR